VLIRARLASFLSEGRPGRLLECAASRLLPEIGRERSHGPQMIVERASAHGRRRGQSRKRRAETRRLAWRVGGGAENGGRGQSSPGVERIYAHSARITAKVPAFRLGRGDSAETVGIGRAAAERLAALGRRKRIIKTVPQSLAETGAGLRAPHDVFAVEPLGLLDIGIRVRRIGFRPQAAPTELTPEPTPTLGPGRKI
jgi:hypothetical protein